MKNSAYELFCKVRRPKRCLYNITHIDNIPSIMQHGILSYNEAQKIANHTSIAMNDVQERRDRISIPNGLNLHDYADSYFNPRNPMMFKRRFLANQLCVLAISAEILDYPGVVVTDGNAASSSTRFYSPYEGIQSLDFVRIFAEWWDDEDIWKKRNNKRIECAEVLVPHLIPYEMVLGAIVVNQSAKKALEQTGFSKLIDIRENIFFR